MQEVWKDVRGYEGFYQVSNKGRVKSSARVITWKDGERKVSEKIMKNQIDKDGYLVVSLNKNKKRNSFKVHRLVATEFLENKENLPVVNHINEDKKDNVPSNLEWCTRKYNSQYSLNRSIIGTHSKTNEKIFFNSTREADNYGFNSCNISLCCNGKAKTHKGYFWEFADKEVLVIV